MPDPDLHRGIVIDPEKRDAKRLDQTLKNLELRVKGLDWWLKCFGIVGAFLGVLITASTAWNGYSLWSEGQRVRMSLELRSRVLPNGKLHVDAVLKNDAQREVNLAIIGVRLWKADWTEGIGVADRPELLLYSDIRVGMCKPGVCGETSDRTQLVELSHPVALASGETDTIALGSYSVMPSLLSEGIWVEGQAYAREYDRGECAVVGRPPIRGAFPFFCETSRVGIPECHVNPDCKFAVDARFVTSTGNQQ